MINFKMVVQWINCFLRASIVFFCNFYWLTTTELLNLMDHGWQNKAVVERKTLDFLRKARHFEPY